MRARPAPMASRTAISRRRAEARAKSRLATFAQAMSSTSATTPIRTSSGFRYTSRRYVQPVPPAGRTNVDWAISFRREAGQCDAITESASRGQTALSRAVAAGIETSARGLARTLNQKLPGPSSGAMAGLTRGSAPTAIVTSAMAPTFAPTKPRGLTPMMVTGTPLIRSVRPTTPASRASGPSQYPWLTTATSAAPGSSSAGASRRPIAGDRPSVS